MIVVIENATGALKMAYFGAEPKPEDYGFPFGDPNVCTHLAVPEGMDPHVVKAVRDAAGTWHVQVDAEKQQEVSRLLWAPTRLKRDQLLAQTDYTMLADFPITGAKLAEMRAYRQALRDLPATAADPADVAWPTQPAA